MVEFMIVYTIGGVVLAGYAWYKWFRACRREINDSDGFNYLKEMKDEALQAKPKSVEKAVQKDSRTSS